MTQERGVLLPWPPARGPFAGGDPTDPGAEPDLFAADTVDEPPVDTRIAATIHPSAVLRADDRDAALAGLVADLRVVAEAMA